MFARISCSRRRRRSNNTWQPVPNVVPGIVSYVDTFWTTAAPGMVWLHGFGDVFEVTLAPGETFDVFHRRWLYKDASVAIERKLQVFPLLLSRLYFFRFTGPGRVGFQSMSNDDNQPASL